MKSNNVVLTLVVHLLAICAIHGQSMKNHHPEIRIVDGSGSLKEIGTLPKHINEASGLEITSSGHLWTHNDGGTPMLFCIDTTGQLHRSLQLNHPNSGWEDLTLDDHGNMYVGAFGNNKNDKRELKIYKLPNPDSIDERVFTAEIIKYHYADQREYPAAPARKNFDADAMAAFGNSLYIFTKNRTSPFTGYSKVYRLPSTPGTYEVSPIDSIFLGNDSMMDSWVTAADFSPDGKTLVLLSHQCLWLITNFNADRFSTGNVVRINMNHFSHKAGVCFNDGETLYIVDELELGFLGGKLYKFDLRPFLINLH